MPSNAGSLNLIDELTEKRSQLSDLMDEMVASPDFDENDEDWKDSQEKAIRLEKRIEAVRKASEMRENVDRLRAITGKPAAGTSESENDIGAALIKSSAFQSYVRNGGSGRAKLLMVPIHQRAVLDTTFYPTMPDRVITTYPRQQTPLLDLMNKQRVASGTVEVVTYPSSDPIAGLVPEGTIKPEATIAVTVNTYTLDQIAHWIEATRQLLDDESRVRDFISNSLLRGVYDKAEIEAIGVVNGGTGYSTATAETMAESIRIGVANVQDAGFSPTAVLINPLDAATLDFFIWQNGNGTPSIGGNVWGLRVVAQSSVPAGTAYVGDWSAGFQYFYKGEADIYISDSDVGTGGASNFKRNIITFLAEMRAKSVLTRPEAICSCTVGTVPLAAKNVAPKPPVKV